MTGIAAPAHRYEQPADLVRVHPDWEGRVKSLIHFGTGAAVDVVDQRIYVPIGASKAVPAAPGLVGLRVGDGGTTNGYIEASNALAGFSGNVTLVFFLPEIGATQDSSGAMLYAVPGSGSYTQFSSDGSGLWVLGSGSPRPLGEDVRGTRNRTIIARAAGADPCQFVDHRKTTSPSVGSIPTGAKTVRIGAWSSAGYQFNGVYGSVAVIAGAITDDEAHQLVDNPWMLYEAERDEIFSLPSAGPVSWSSLTASGITQTGATLTLGGITR